MSTSRRGKAFGCRNSRGRRARRVVTRGWHGRKWSRLGAGRRFARRFIRWPGNARHVYPLAPLRLRRIRCRARTVAGGVRRQQALINSRRFENAMPMCATENFRRTRLGTSPLPTHASCGTNGYRSNTSVELAGIDVRWSQDRAREALRE